MNNVLRVTLVGTLGLALGFGSGWAWDTATGEPTSEAPGTSATPTDTPG